jgi:hypothetical protein
MRIHATVALALLVSYLKSVNLGRSIRLRVMVEMVFLIAKRPFGVPSFFNYEIAYEIWNLLFSDKTAFQGVNKAPPGRFSAMFWPWMRLRKLQGEFVIDNTADFWLRYPKSIFARTAVMASLQINEILIKFKGRDLSNNELSRLLAWYLLPTLDCPNNLGAWRWGTITCSKIARFLACDEDSSFLNGITLNVQGGMTLGYRKV